MLTQQFVYWFTRLDHIHSFCSGLAFLCGMAVVVSGIVWVAMTISKAMIESDKQSFGTIDCAICQNIARTAGKICIACLISCTLMNLSTAFVPTTKEMAAIYAVPKIANNENLQEISGEMVSLAKEWLKELHPKNTSSKIVPYAKSIANTALSNTVDNLTSELTK